MNWPLSVENITMKYMPIYDNVSSSSLTKWNLWHGVDRVITQKIVLKWLFVSETGEKTAWSLFSSDGMELLELIKFYSWHGLEMDECSAVTLGKTAQSLFSLF